MINGTEELMYLANLHETDLSRSKKFRARF